MWSPSGPGRKTTARFYPPTQKQWSSHAVLTGHLTHPQAGNGVYELSEFASIHPGQRAAITRNCGEHVSNWGITSGSAHPAYVYVAMMLRRGMCAAMWDSVIADLLEYDPV